MLIRTLTEKLWCLLALLGYNNVSDDIRHWSFSENRTSYSKKNNRYKIAEQIKYPSLKVTHTKVRRARCWMCWHLSQQILSRCWQHHLPFPWGTSPFWKARLIQLLNTLNKTLIQILDILFVQFWTSLGRCNQILEWCLVGGWETIGANWNEMFFTTSTVKQWAALPTEVVQPRSIKVLKALLKEVLSSLAWSHSWPCFESNYPVNPWVHVPRQKKKKIYKGKEMWRIAEVGIIKLRCRYKYDDRMTADYF